MTLAELRDLRLRGKRPRDAVILHDGRSARFGGLGCPVRVSLSRWRSEALDALHGLVVVAIFAEITPRVIEFLAAVAAVGPTALALRDPVSGETCPVADGPYCSWSWLGGRT